MLMPYYYFIQHSNYFMIRCLCVMMRCYIMIDLHETVYQYVVTGVKHESARSGLELIAVKFCLCFCVYCMNVFVFSIQPNGHILHQWCDNNTLFFRFDHVGMQIISFLLDKFHFSKIPNGCVKYALVYNEDTFFINPSAISSPDILWEYWNFGVKRSFRYIYHVYTAYFISTCSTDDDEWLSLCEYIVMITCRVGLLDIWQLIANTMRTERDYPALFVCTRHFGQVTYFTDIWHKIHRYLHKLFSKSTVHIIKHCGNV